jgi:hypothetical protein
MCENPFVCAPLRKLRRVISVGNLFSSIIGFEGAFDFAAYQRELGTTIFFISLLARPPEIPGSKLAVLFCHLRPSFAVSVNYIELLALCYFLTSLNGVSFKCDRKANKAFP